MQDDPEEKHNLYMENPAKVRDLLDLLRKQVSDGRSNPGLPQANDVSVDIWKLDTMPEIDPYVVDDY